MKTKEQYLDDLRKGARRALLNDTEKDSWEQEQAAAIFYASPLVRETFPGSLLCAYGFSAGTMAQKKESQNVIDHLHDSTQQVIDLCGEMAEKLSEADVEKFLPRVREITKNCKLDYVPFKGD